MSESDEENGPRRLVGPIAGDLAAAIGAVASAVESGRHARWKTENLTATPGYAGLQHEGGLMVVGRAANGGFSDCWLPLEGSDPVHARQIAEGVTAEPSSCPMNWLGTQYNPNNSGFWRSIRAVLSMLEGDNFTEENWPSRIAWSNLYKIAPAAEGNPPDPLCWAQLDYCNRMLKSEIDTFRPRRLVFVTDRDWLTWFEEYVADPWLKVEHSGGKYVTGSGQLAVGNSAIPFIVTRRPDSRERGSSESQWADEVATALLVMN